MRKFVRLFSGLLLTIGFVAAVPGSAQATSPEYFGPWSCQTYRDIATCLSLDWARQADGSGVRLEGIQVWTSQGCGSLESGGRYDPVQASAINVPTMTPDYLYNFGEEPCDFYKDVSNAVGATGNAQIRVEMHARINNAGDRQLYWNIQLTPAGGHTVLEKSVRDI